MSSEVEYQPENEVSRPSRLRKMINFLKSNQSLFYYCALISSWDDRSWFFLIGIYLVALDPSNLILTASFGFISSGVVLLFGSWIGSWVDKTTRLKAAILVLAIRNLSTLISSICLCLVFFYYDDVVVNNLYPNLKLLAELILITFGVLAHVAGLANNNILTRDWLAIHCLSNSNLLAKMSSRFRLIDLVSKIVAPVIIGQIMTFASKAVAAIFFSVQVLLTLTLFGVLLNIIYRRTPRLHYREEEEIPEEETAIISGESVSITHKAIWKRPIEGWIVYFHQPILLAGIGLGLLYMTVLGFDTVTTGYALSQGMTESILGFFNSGAAITGILGALIYPPLSSRFGLVPTGVIALVVQVIGLSPCGVSVWAPGSPFNLSDTAISFNSSSISPYIANKWSPSLMLLMSGIVASRVGLWMFDLTISQLLVETVSEIHRGKVNGVQNSLNMLFDMIKFGLVLGFPLPRQFGLLILLSIAAIVIGCLCYLIFAVVNKCTIQSKIMSQTKEISS